MPSGPVFAASTASAAASRAVDPVGLAEPHPGAGQRADREAVPAGDHLAVDGGPFEVTACRGIPRVIPALAAGAVDPRLGVLRGAEASARLPQHPEQERRDAPRGVDVAGIERDREQLRIVGEHALEVRHRPVAARGVAEEPAFDRVAQLGRRHRGERPVCDDGCLLRPLAHGPGLQEPQRRRDGELRARSGRRPRSRRTQGLRAPRGCARQRRAPPRRGPRPRPPSSERGRRRAPPRSRRQSLRRHLAGSSTPRARRRGPDRTRATPTAAPAESTCRRRTDRRPGWRTRSAASRGAG